MFSPLTNYRSEVQVNDSNGSIQLDTRIDESNKYNNR